VRIDWVILCRDLHGRGNSFDLHGAPLDTVWVPELPTHVGFFALVRLVALVEDLASRDEQHQLEAYVIGPGPAMRGHLLFDFEQPSVPHGYDTAWEIPDIHPLALEFEAAGYGLHSLDLYLDGAYGKSVPFAIRER
jgi:hypothetical protein